MTTAQAQPYSHDLIHAGVDWLTATANRGLEGRPFREVGDALKDEQTAAGDVLHRAAVRDYVGWRGRGLFVGTREQDRLIVLSSDMAARHWSTVTRAARNVSRIDLQASVWTHGEQPALARMAYQKLKRAPPRRGRPRSYTLIRTHPQGETLNVGKRQSDSYGRLYDWASAHKAGLAQTVWRYEVEFKRHLAAHHSAGLLAAADSRTHIERQVHSWFDTRGVRPTWTPTGSRFSNDKPLVEPNRDTLAWFRTSVSKTISKAINQHGLEAVLLALGLSDVVQPRRRR